MKKYFLICLFFLFCLSSCVPSREKPDDSFFTVNYNTTLRGLESAGYNLTDTFYFGNYYTNMPAEIEFVNMEILSHTAAGRKYIDNNIGGKKVNYHYDNGRVVKREMYYYRHALDDSTSFDVSTLYEIFERENCKCEFIKLDTITKQITVWRGVVKNEENQIHLFEMSSTMISIFSKFP